MEASDRLLQAAFVAGILKARLGFPKIPDPGEKYGLIIPVIAKGDKA